MSNLYVEMTLFAHLSYTGNNNHLPIWMFELIELCRWHRDIKPNNIPVFRTADSPYRWTFKLADLGLSHFEAELVTRTEAKSLDLFDNKTYGISIR